MTVSLDLDVLCSSPEEGRDADCISSVIAFDFERKVDRVMSLGKARKALAAGHFVWIDILAREREEARRVLSSLELLDEEVVEAALRKEPSTQHARYERYLHLVVSECHALGSGFELRRVDVILGERIFLTIHTAPIDFLATLRKEYKNDFVRFAKSPSFMLYEIWAHLLDGYLSVQKVMEDRVERLQDELRSEHVSEGVFGRISDLGSDLLHFRKVVLPARAVLTDLASRRSVFLSETTQSFLANMAGTIEHVLQDLLVDRDILSDALNLHMSLLGHRTNQVMKKLTAVSAIFLPLSFLAGVYGTNFDQVPELHWTYGYLYFWGAIVLLAAGLLVVLRRARLL
jgi:magnesium/cobalt transport protein CorA